MTGMWGNAARRHWQRNLPHRYAALPDPDRFFADLDQAAGDRYLRLRDSLLRGLNPNDGTITWPEFFERTDQAARIAQSIVLAEMIYVHDEEIDDLGLGS